MYEHYGNDYHQAFSGAKSYLGQWLPPSPPLNPIIHSISPLSGGVGSEVTIFGDNLLGSRVMFGSIKAEVIPQNPPQDAWSAQAWSPDPRVIKVKVPTGIVGPVNIIVVNDRINAFITSKEYFTSTEMTQQVAIQAVLQREGALTADLEAQKKAREELQKEREAFEASQKKFQADQEALSKTQAGVVQAQSDFQKSQEQMKKNQEQMKKILYGGAGLLTIFLFLKLVKVL